LTSVSKNTDSKLEYDNPHLDLHNGMNLLSKIFVKVVAFKIFNEINHLAKHLYTPASSDSSKLYKMSCDLRAKNTFGKNFENFVI